MICSVCAVGAKIKYKKRGIGEIEKRGELVGVKKAHFGWITRYRILTEEDKIEYVNQ